MNTSNPEKNVKATIIRSGVIEGQWDVTCTGELFDKFSRLCKKIFQKPYWGDQYRTMTRRKDPNYVVLRNSTRAKTVLVLIDANKAPENYMEELTKLYNW